MDARTRARAGMQRAGGIAALYIAVAYLAAIPYFLLLVNYPGVVDPVQKVALVPGVQRCRWASQTLLP